MSFPHPGLEGSRARCQAVVVGESGPWKAWGLLRALGSVERVWEPCRSGACRLLRTAERRHQALPREVAGWGALKLPCSGRGPHGCSVPGSWCRSEQRDSTRALPAPRVIQISEAPAPGLSLTGSGNSLLPGYCYHHFHLRMRKSRLI